MKIPILLGIIVASLIAITSFDDAFAQYSGNVETEGIPELEFDIMYNDLLFKITGYEEDHIYFSKFFEDGALMSTAAYKINEFEGGDTWVPLNFRSEGFDAELEWKWYYDENFFIELDSIKWNRAEESLPALPLDIPTQLPFETTFFKNPITPVMNSGIHGCETTSTGCYTPNPMYVTIGDTVTFYNSDNVSHTFTSGTPDDGANGKFDTGLLTPSESFKFSSDETGTFPYYCALHDWMVGVIIVQHSDFTTPSSISVFTDDVSYHGKDRIEIYGKITKNVGPSFVRLSVETSSGLTVYDSYDTLNFVDNTFDRTVIPEPSWKAGTYFVTVSYGTSNPNSHDLSDDTFSRTSFEYTGYSKISVDYVNDFDSILVTDFDSLLEEIDYDSLVEEIDEFETIETHEDSGVNDSYNEENLLNHEQKEIVITSKQLDPQTQNKVKTLDSQITREQTQYEEYLKQYDYYEGKTLSQNDAKKFQIIAGKLDTQNEKIGSLIDKRNTILFESKDVSKSIEYNSEPQFYFELPSKPIEDKVEPIKDKVVPPQHTKIEIKVQKDPTCFLFWCW